MPHKSLRDHLEYNRRWCLANPEKVRASRRKHYLANRSQILDQCKKRYEANREGILRTQKKYRDAHPEEVSAKYRRWYAAHREEHLIKTKAWLESHPMATRKHRIKHKYGLTEPEYLTMLAAQGNACAICRTDFDDARKSTTPHVDHCHATGKTRALLCHRCNVGLGSFRDKTELLTAAISYLEAARV